MMEAVENREFPKEALPHWDKVKKKGWITPNICFIFTSNTPPHLNTSSKTKVVSGTSDVLIQ